MLTARNQANNHSQKFKYWRLSQLFLALLLTLFVLHSVFSIDKQTEKLAKVHIINGINAQLSLISAPAQLLMQQTTSKYKARRNIAKKQLTSLSQKLNTQAEISQVNFYNKYGNSIITTDSNTKPLEAYLPIGNDNEKPELENGHEVHIQALYSENNEVIGFVEVMINKYHFTGMLKTTKRKNDQKIRIILLCSIFIGVFLTKAFSRKHKLNTK